jgi:hypothetical protein
MVLLFLVFTAVNVVAQVTKSDCVLTAEKFSKEVQEEVGKRGIADDISIAKICPKMPDIKTSLMKCSPTDRDMAAIHFYSARLFCTRVNGIPCLTIGAYSSPEAEAIKGLCTCNGYTYADLIDFGVTNLPMGEGLISTFKQSCAKEGLELVPIRDSGLSVGAIVGIVIGIVLSLVIITCICLWRRNKRKIDSKYIFVM